MATFYVDIGNVVVNLGYLGVFALIFFESAGIPLPGETALISAAIYAGTTHKLEIEFVLLAATAAAIFGDNLGFWVGRRFGFDLLHRYGSYVRLTAPRLKIGQMLFQKHGAKVVFFGRFTAILRTYAAMLAGANRFSPAQFFLWNATGGVAWALIFGLAGYFFGHSIRYFTGPVSIGISVAFVVGAIPMYFIFRKHEERLVAEAERTFSGDEISDVSLR
jgi:membrane protein DedA with SNARE-associated domain